MKTVAERFGRNLRAMRKKHGISQDKLAILADLDRSYMGRVERGEVSISLEKAWLLANTLKCKLDDLLS